MKFTVTMKSPDALNYAMDDLRTILIEDGVSDEDDREDLIEQARDFANRWMRWGEYIDVEFDTEEGTAKVV